MTKIKSTFSVLSNFLTKAALVALVLVMYNVRLVCRSVVRSVSQIRDSSEALGLRSLLDLKNV